MVISIFRSKFDNMFFNQRTRVGSRFLCRLYVLTSHEVLTEFPVSRNSISAANAVRNQLITKITVMPLECQLSHVFGPSSIMIPEL